MKRLIRTFRINHKSDLFHPAIWIILYLDRNDYEEYLMGLDRVTREQLMNGNWNAS